jgi:hypothetical protein
MRVAFRLDPRREKSQKKIPLYGNSCYPSSLFFGLFDMAVEICLFCRDKRAASALYAAKRENHESATHNPLKHNESTALF